MADKYENNREGITAPAGGAFSITASDTTNYLTDAGRTVPRSIYVGTTGNVAVVTMEGQTVTFVGASGILPIRVKQVLSTGTTASDIVGMY